MQSSPEEADDGPAERAAETPREVRRRKILGLADRADLAGGPGIELGPLDSPLAPKGEFDVRYVDVSTTESLRAHYRGDPAVTLDRIVEVDFCLTGDDGVRTLAEVAARDAPYRWAIASHVIEHVPDLIGWLADIAELLEDDGLLLLAVPDRRYTFDVLRPPTTVGQLLEAHARHDVIPSERAVFDHFRSCVAVPPATLWAGVTRGQLRRVYTLEQAVERRRAATERGEYVDSHVWVFTPAEFTAQLAELGRLELCELVIERVVPTSPGELEFYVVARRLPRDALPERCAELRDRAVSLGPTDEDARHAGGTEAGGLSDLSALETTLIMGKRTVMRRLRELRADALSRGRHGRSWAQQFGKR